VLQNDYGLADTYNNTILCLSWVTSSIRDPTWLLCTHPLLCIVYLTHKLIDKCNYACTYVDLYVKWCMAIHSAMHCLNSLFQCLYLQQSLLVTLLHHVFYTVNGYFDWFYYFEYFVVECFIRVFHFVAPSLLYDSIFYSHLKVAVKWPAGGRPLLLLKLLNCYIPIFLQN